MSEYYYIIPDIIEVIQGSYSGSTLLSLKEQGLEPVDLATATKVEITITKPDGTKIADRYLIQIHEAASGIVAYAPIASHVTDAGTFEGEIVVTWENTSVSYIPSRGKLLFIVYSGVT